MGLVAALICLPSAAQSQEPIRAKLMAAPRPGRPALRIDWAALARRADSLKSPRIVLVGVGRAGMSEVQGLSGSLGGSLKVLADSGAGSIANSASATGIWAGRSWSWRTTGPW